MRISADSRKMLSTVLATLVVISAVPVIVMLGCTMNMAATGGDCTHGMEVLSSACGGSYVVLQHTADAILTSGFSLTLLLMLAAFVAAVVIFRADARSRAFVLEPANAPPPPEDPLGVRLTL